MTTFSDFYNDQTRFDFTAFKNLIENDPYNFKSLDISGNTSLWALAAERKLPSTICRFKGTPINKLIAIRYYGDLFHMKDMVAFFIDTPDFTISRRFGDVGHFTSGLAFTGDRRTMDGSGEYLLASYPFEVFRRTYNERLCYYDPDNPHNMIVPNMRLLEESKRRYEILNYYLSLPSDTVLNNSFKTTWHFKLQDRKKLIKIANDLGIEMDLTDEDIVDLL